MSTSVFQIPKNTGFTYGVPKLPNSKADGARELFGRTLDKINDITPPNMGQYIMYFLSILVVLFAILMFIHYFITPIWQLNPGGSGVIPLPGFNDAKVYWTNVKDEKPLNDLSGGVAPMTSNWSMTLDIYISDAVGHESSPRILFARYPNNVGPVPISTSSIFLTDSLSDYNIAMALIPSTNDLIVSTMNVNNNSEDVIIPNVPIKKPFRIGVILFNTMMEVYVNGMLYKTKQFNAPMKTVYGFFRPTPSSNIGNTVKVKNLIIWKRTVTASEMRYAKPTLADASEFDLASMDSTSGGCAINMVRDISSAVSEGPAAAAAAMSYVSSAVL